MIPVTASLFMVLVAIAGAGFGLWLGSPATPAAQPVVSATVTVEVGNGHGSGVHIGNGFFVTAAHVVEDQRKAVIATEENSAKVDAAVAWVAKEYDIALLKVDTTNVYQPTFRVVRMDCRNPTVGETVSAVGYPLDFGKITTKGQIAGKAQKYGDWKSAVFVDITGGPGMSGGPVLSAASGKLRGITVGGLHPMSPIMLMVPSSAICGLLANGGL